MCLVTIQFGKLCCIRGWRVGLRLVRVRIRWRIFEHRVGGCRLDFFWRDR